MSKSSTLLSRLRTIDPEAVELVNTEDTSWVRTRLGIVGLIQLENSLPLERAPSVVPSEIERAHLLLDDLPLTVFRRSDVWNLLLFISVPYERGVSPEHATLEAQCDDLVGSRKVILWKGEQLEDNLRPLRTATQHEVGPDDPFGEVLEEHARDAGERHALDVLYKRRLEDTDIDELVRTLGREVEE